MTTPTPGRWPNPADTPLDAARHIAREYRDIVAQLDPDTCNRLDALATARGQAWIAPTVDHINPDDWLPAGDLAELCGVTTATVRQWAHRGHLRRIPTDHGRYRYRVGDVIERQAHQRRARMARAHHTTRKDTP